MGDILFEKVLLVEDEAAHAVIIKHALTKFCSEIKHVVTLNDALTSVPAFIPELIISDLHLPDASGIQDMSELLNNNIPIIVLTASTSWSDAVTAMKLGAKDFIVKDFSNGFSDAIGLALSRVHSSVQLQKERQKLLKEMMVLRNTIENSNDSLAITTPEGVIQYSNTAFKNFAERCGSTGQDLHDFFSDKVVKHTELTNAIFEHLATLESGAVWHTEVNFIDEKTAYDLSLAAATDSSTKEYVIWIKDVTDMKRREKFQREILSTTTHDLKGPLGAISLSAELLDSLTEKGSKANEIALRVASSAQGALNLIDEFLSSRRMQEGSFIMKPTDTVLDEAFQDVFSNYETIANAKEITFNQCIAPNLHANLDKLGFERVISNLLNNAFKFTPRGGTVSVGCKLSDDGEIVVDISDTGSGMEPAEVTQIFQRFTRLERHNEVEGTGIGLSVVKNIVSAHGGSIEVTSKVGQGTTFRVIFPAHPPTNEHGELISLDFI